MACSALVEQQALVGFLGGYSGLTRDAYALDLRQFAAWCQQRQLALFDVARHDIEGFARQLEDSVGHGRRSHGGCARSPRCTATPSRKDCSIAHRRCMCVGRVLDYESNATGLDRNEVGAMLVAAGLAGARDHALISLLALERAARVTEAIGADIERLGLERGHRTLVVLRKGGKTVTVPLAPRTARAVDLVVGERSRGTDLRSTATDNDSIATVQPGSCVASPAAPGSTSASDRTPCATPSSPPPWTPVSRLRDVQEAASHADPRTTMRYDRARVSLDRHATYIVSTFIAGASR